MRLLGGWHTQGSRTSRHERYFATQWDSSCVDLLTQHPNYVLGINVPIVVVQRNGTGGSLDPSDVATELVIEDHARRPKNDQKALVRKCGKRSRCNIARHSHYISYGELLIAR
jgi:hypothetical protein